VDDDDEDDDQGGGCCCCCCCCCGCCWEEGERGWDENDVCVAFHEWVNTIGWVGRRLMVMATTRRMIEIVRDK